jgi:transposase InsO family protein
VKYSFIDRHRSVWPVYVQCRVLGVSATGYHQLRLHSTLGYSSPVEYEQRWLAQQVKAAA